MNRNYEKIPHTSRRRSAVTEAPLHDFVLQFKFANVMMGRQGYISDEEDTPVSIDDFLPHHVQSEYSTCRWRLVCSGTQVLSSQRLENAGFSEQVLLANLGRNADCAWVWDADDGCLWACVCVCVCVCETQYLKPSVCVVVEGEIVWN